MIQPAQIENAFGFDRHFKVKAEQFSKPGLIARLNHALAVYMKPRAFNLPQFGALVACGDYGCVYRASDRTPRLYKVIPQRIQDTDYIEGAYYNQDQFRMEVEKTRLLGESNVGPRLHHSFVLRVPLLEKEGAAIEFNRGGDGKHMILYIMLMAALTVRMNPGGRSPEKGIDSERDEPELFQRKTQLIKSAQEIIHCQLDVPDVEWGYNGTPELANLRIFDVDCAGPRAQPADLPPSMKRQALE